jgi:ATP-dependent DNA helicase RecG
VSADLDFLRLVLDEEQRLVGAVPIDALIALACLREQRRLTRHELATAIQKTDGVALGTLEALVERGLVAAHGQGRGRTYTLAAQVYARHGQRAEYTRQAGFDRLQQEQMVRAYVRKHGEIRRQDVIDLCRIGSDQAKRLLARLVEERVLAREGTGKSTRYVSGDRA